MDGSHLITSVRMDPGHSLCLGPFLSLPTCIRWHLPDLGDDPLRSSGTFDGEDHVRLRTFRSVISGKMWVSLV